MNFFSLIYKNPEFESSFQKSLHISSLLDFFLLNSVLILTIAIQQAFSQSSFTSYYLMALFLSFILATISLKVLPKSFSIYMKPIFSFILTISYSEIIGLLQIRTNFFQYWTFGLFHIMISDDPSHWLASIEVPILNVYYMMRISVDKENEVFKISSFFFAFLFFLLRYYRNFREKRWIRPILQENDDLKALKNVLYDEFNGNFLHLSLKKKPERSTFKKIQEKILRVVCTKGKKKNYTAKSTAFKTKTMQSTFNFRSMIVKEMSQIARNAYGDIKGSAELLGDFLSNFSICLEQKYEKTHEKTSSNVLNREFSTIKMLDFQETEKPLIFLLSNMIKSPLNKKAKSIDVTGNSQMKSKIKIIPLRKSLAVIIENQRSPETTPQAMVPLLEELEILKKNDVIKDRLLASVSHDMRSPLNGIIFYLKSAKETENLFLRTQKLDYALINSQLLLFIINDLLDFSLYKNNSKLTLNLTKFSLKIVLEEIFNCMRIEAVNKGITLLIQNECNKNLCLMSDEGRLKQVLINLLTNAIKFTFHGYVKIKITPVVHCDNLIKFEVLDTGLGIKPEILPLLMKPFATFDFPDHKINRNGIGLGLYICKTIVAVLGPNEGLFIHSELERGSKFGFLAYIMNESEQSNKEMQSMVEKSMPRLFEREIDYFQEENALESDMRDFQIKSRNISNKSFYTRTLMSSRGINTANSFNQKSALSNKSKKSKSSILPYKLPTFNPFASPNKLCASPKVASEYALDSSYFRSTLMHNILIVDDQVFNLMILYEMLTSFKEYNICIDKATNGLMAIEMFSMKNSQESEEDPYEIIFMDCEMPLLNGVEATKIIRSKIYKEGYKEVKVIGCTGDYEMAGIQERQKLKANELIGMDDCFVKPISSETVFKCLKKYI